MPNLSARLIKRIEQDFPDAGSAQEMAHLVKTVDASERIQAAIIVSAHGDLGRFRGSVPCQARLARRACSSRTR